MYGLSNEQILFMYYSMKVVEDRYKEVIRTHEVSQQIFSGRFMLAHTRLPAEVIKDLKESEHYKMLGETIKVLNPIVELIEDVEPEMAAKIYQLFQ